MNIRWIGIILILIAGLGCMYFIVTNSTSVGNAVSVISDVTITLPPGYITSEDGSEFCVLFNKATNETIRMKCLKDSTNYIKEYNVELKSLEKQSDIIIEKNFTNETLSMIVYENQSSVDKKNMTVAYFDKCNHTFSMKFEHFTDEKSKEDAINYIIGHLKYDFKQNG